MKPSEIVTMARQDTGTTTGLMSDVIAYTRLNLAINDAWRDAINLDTSLDNTSWNISTTAGTGSYTMTSPIANTTLASSTFGVGNKLKVWVKWTTDQTYYQPIKVIYSETNPNLADTYAAGNTIEPFAIVTGYTLKIFPTPTNSVTNGIQIEGARQHFPLGVTWSTVVTEDVAGCILLPEDKHDLIVEWLKYYMYLYRGSNFRDLAREQKAFYESEKKRVLMATPDNAQQSADQQEPDLSEFSNN